MSTSSVAPVVDTLSFVRVVNAFGLTFQKQWPFLVSLGLHAAVIGLGVGLLSSPAEFAMNVGEPGSSALGTVISVDVVTEVLNDGPQKVAVRPEEPASPETRAEASQAEEPLLPDPEPEPEISLSPVRKVELPKVEKKPVAPKKLKNSTKPTKRESDESLVRARMAPMSPNALAGTSSGTAGADTGGSAGAAMGAQPDYLKNPPPPYPKASRRAGEEGTVILSAEVNAAGRVEDVMVKRSSSHPRLDRAALDAVKRWHFKPKKVAGYPVASRVDVPITFVLRG